MVTLIRTADVNGADKRQKALEWAKKVAEYVNGKFGLVDVEVGIEAYGSVGRVFWIGREESLESLARGALDSMADEAYLQIEAQTAGLFVPGSVHDTVIVGI
jgi:nucleotide-binding universal stress UspA family protein